MDCHLDWSYNDPYTIYYATGGTSSSNNYDFGGSTGGGIYYVVHDGISEVRSWMGSPERTSHYIWSYSDLYILTGVNSGFSGYCGIYNDLTYPRDRAAPQDGSPSDVDHNYYYVNPADTYHGEFTGGGRNSAGWGDNGSTSDGLFYFTYRRYPSFTKGFCEGSQYDRSLVIFGRSLQSLWVLVGTY